MMILVDRRFAMNDKRRKLPEWIQQQLKENINLSTEAAVTVARKFFKEMAQPWDKDKDLGSTLFDFGALRAKGLDIPRQPDAAPATFAEISPQATGLPAESLVLRPIAESSTFPKMRNPKRSR